MQVIRTQESGKSNLDKIEFQLPLITMEAQSHRLPEREIVGGMEELACLRAGAAFASPAQLRPQYGCSLVPSLCFGLRLQY